MGWGFKQFVVTSPSWAGNSKAFSYRGRGNDQYSVESSQRDVDDMDRVKDNVTSGILFEQWWYRNDTTDRYLSQNAGYE